MYLSGDVDVVVVSEMVDLRWREEKVRGGACSNFLWFL